MNEKIKAKAYDEALERAKRLQHDNAWVTTIFPELKESDDEKMESEDERIRKLLVRFVKYEMPDNYSDDISKDSCLAYLEKKKELYQNVVESANYELAETEKREFVTGKFLRCRNDSTMFKGGEYYWLEYLGDDMYVGRSDNFLNINVHITPQQLFTNFYLDTSGVKQKEQDEEHVALKCNSPIYDENPSDDRIIDASIHYLREQEGFLTGIDCISTKAILDWLEKQKEQKILQSDGIGAAILSALASGIETDEILKVRGFTYDDVEKYLTLMEQKEQKPAEWSEEDKKKLEDIIMCGEKHLYLDDGNIDWVKSLPERFNLRPRQEWTLYDEKLLGEVMVAVETDKFFSEQDQKRIVSWLRSLRPYPQDMKESVCGSEGDEEAINGAIGILLQDNEPNFVFPEHSKLSIGEIVKRLKSLKPQPKQEWSGKDRQMLRDCVDALREGANGRVIVIDYEEHENWLESLPERFNLQPKQEWSEEDSNILKVIKAELEKYIMISQYGTPLSVFEIGWLEQLPERFSLQQKQEWSKEDEEMRDYIIHALANNTYAEEEGPVLYAKEISWLKSLRPQQN